jgi:hypothetical protein
MSSEVAVRFVLPRLCVQPEWRVMPRSLQNVEQDAYSQQRTQKRDHSRHPHQLANRNSPRMAGEG